MKAGVRHRYEWRGTGQTLGTVRIDDGESLASKVINAARIGLCGDGSRKLSLVTVIENHAERLEPDRKITYMETSGGGLAVT